jgi:hypothetical protein
MFDYTLTLQQLCQAKNYMGRLKAMIGMRDLVVYGSTVSFKFKSSRKANILVIDYDHDNDLYIMVFFRGVEQVERIVGLYAEDLKPIFERVTGLYLSL